MEVDEIKERQRGIWALRDYSRLSEILRPAAVELCDACAVSAGQEVLDVAAGDGNFALACAAEGASVVAVDFSPEMVALGRSRSEAEGYAVEWVLGDAEALPFAAERFDCVGSVFGAMIAPRPAVVARELFRVVRPGNTVGLTAWTPGSFPSDLFQLGRRYQPPVADVPVPEEWAVEETARSRFEGLAATVDFQTRALTWSAESAEALTAEIESVTPNWAMARRNLPPDRYEAMRAELLELVRRRGGDGPVTIEHEYALIVARRRG
jgi:ubiquinone/menaquinone biosynthesis C-methylase UbiE